MAEVRKHNSRQGVPGVGNLTRRELLEATAAGTAAWACAMIPGCGGGAAANPSAASAGAAARASALYFDLLKTWCDGLLAHQIDEPGNPARHGALRCPACSILHGRCADAAYPLLCMADATGERKYLEAALRVRAWAEANVSQSDGSWLNESSDSTWKGITVFGAIALAESLRHHGGLLDEATRKAWTQRLARAAGFLDKFMTLSVGNINYPVTSSLAFMLAGEVLGDSHYRDRGREMARASLDYFTEHGLLFGEGKPQTARTPKKCRPVDLGYNVEESLPALAMYALLTGDRKVLEATVTSLRAHLEFLLPDGGWDNSWGSRQAKWTWWGSRTSDGCQSAMVLLAGHDPRFREAALRNTRQMAACTHGGLLYGGPHYHHCGYPPCVHHTFTHAKALATVLDSGAKPLLTPAPVALPRDEAKGLNHFPEIGTYLAAAGPWRATVTEYDLEYAKNPGGHPSGGALSLLYHLNLGPIFAASMTQYTLVEAHNMQTHRDSHTMCLTPRLEYVQKSKEDAACTNISDFTAELAAQESGGVVSFATRGRLVSLERRDPAGGAVNFRLAYRLAGNTVEIRAAASIGSGAVKLILPVICPADERVECPDARTVRIVKPAGTLTFRTSAPAGWETLAPHRVFNLVPGFECLPLTVVLPQEEIAVELTAGTSGGSAK